MTTVDDLIEAQERFERPIRVRILEQMFEYHTREYKTMERCSMFAGDHYTYRDSARAHLIAAEWVAREHIDAEFAAPRDAAQSRSEDGQNASMGASENLLAQE